MPQRKYVDKLWPTEKTLVIQNGKSVEIPTLGGKPTIKDMVLHGVKTSGHQGDPTENEVLQMVRSARIEGRFLIVTIQPDAKS